MSVVECQLSGIGRQMSAVELMIIILVTADRVTGRIAEERVRDKGGKRRRRRRKQKKRGWTEREKRRR